MLEFLVQRARLEFHTRAMVWAVELPLELCQGGNKEYWVSKAEGVVFKTTK
jgi:hypothetical protein